MQTVRIGRRQSLWLTVLLVTALAFIFAACGANSSTGTGSNPGTPPTYTTVQGYGTTYGCPSDAVVNPAPAAPNVVIKMNQTNSTVTAHSGDVIEVHLPFGHVWQGPTASQGVLTLQGPAGYALKDQSVCVWRFTAQGTGTTELNF